MDSKYKVYKEYRFEDNPQWINYYENIYPRPSYDIIDKIKRKWFKKNIDAEFEVEYNPESSSTKQANNQNPQQNQNGEQPRDNAAGAAGASGATGAQAGPPKVALAHHIRYWLYVAFILTLPFKGLSAYIIIAAIIIGIMKKYGLPKFSMDYFKRIMIDDEFHNLCYAFLCNLGSSSSLILNIPLIMSAYLNISRYAKVMLTKYPNVPLINRLKPQFEKAVMFRDQFELLKADAETYIGIYLVAGVFFGWTSFFLVFIYWQFIRMKYMLNANTRLSFAKVSTKMDEWIGNPRCPGIVKMLLQKIRQLGAYLVKSEDGQQARPGCTIF